MNYNYSQSDKDLAAANREKYLTRRTNESQNDFFIRLQSEGLTRGAASILSTERANSNFTLAGLGEEYTDEAMKKRSQAEMAQRNRQGMAANILTGTGFSTASGRQGLGTNPNQTSIARKTLLGA